MCIRMCHPICRPILIFGPTASGKSLLAIKIASHVIRKGIGARIINADSMQVYCDLPILTACPSLQDKRDFLHKLYEFKQPNETYSVGQWTVDVMQIINNNKKDTLNIIVGGTGLYMMALTRGLSSSLPVVSDSIRREVGQYVNKNASSAYQKLLQIDPVFAKRISCSDLQRIKRGLEIYEVSNGRPISNFFKDTKPILSHFSGIVVHPNKSILHQAIKKRYASMVKFGIFSEVESFIKKYPDYGDLKQSSCIGFSNISSHILGLCSYPEMEDGFLMNTMKYIKMQSTWARRKFSSFRWIADDLDGISISALLKEVGIKEVDISGMD